MRPIARRITSGVAAAVLLVVVLPPLSTAALHLYAAHMMQHLLLIAVAAPLLAASGSFARLDGVLSPVAAWATFVGVFLFWHWPVAFQWAAQAETTRLLELATIFAAVSLFWLVAFSPTKLNPGAAGLYVMTAAVATDLPGVIMIFAPRAICTMPAENAGLWGLTPMQDQQLAGLLMWVPANLIFFSIAIWLFARWLSHDKPKLVMP